MIATLQTTNFIHEIYYKIQFINERKTQQRNDFTLGIGQRL